MSLAEIIDRQSDAHVAEGKQDLTRLRMVVHKHALRDLEFKQRGLHARIAQNALYKGTQRAECMGFV